MVGVTLVGVSGVVVGDSGVVVGDSAGIAGVGGAEVEEDGSGSASAELPDIMTSNSAHVGASTIAPARHELQCPPRQQTDAMSAASRHSQSVS